MFTSHPKAMACVVMLGDWFCL